MPRVFSRIEHGFHTHSITQEEQAQREPSDAAIPQQNIARVTMRTSTAAFKAGSWGYGDCMAIDSALRELGED